MSVAADYAQVNARVRPELKKSGEAALANAGYTPTKAIRLLYAFASEHASSPQAIADYLEGAGAAMGRRDAPTDAQAEQLEAEGKAIIIRPTMQEVSRLESNEDELMMSYYHGYTKAKEYIDAIHQFME